MNKVYFKDRDAWNRARLSDSVSDRVKELLDYTAENRLVRRATSQLDLSQLAPFFGRSLTPEEREQAKDQFIKALDLFAKKIADATFHPLSEMLKASGLPGILEDVIKDLYRSEVSRLSKDLTRPVADVIFRPAALAPDRTVLTVPEAARREVFDPSSMPSKFLTPSYVDRLNRTWAREQVVNSVRRAARR